MTLKNFFIWTGQNFNTLEHFWSVPTCEFWMSLLYIFIPYENVTLYSEYYTIKTKPIQKLTIAEVKSVNLFVTVVRNLVCCDDWCFKFY